MAGIEGVGSGSQPIQIDQSSGQTDQLDQAQQGKSIGQKIAGFFKSIASAIAKPFIAFGRAIANLASNTATAGGTTATATQTRLTTEQKAEMLQTAKSGEFYAALTQSTTSMVNAENFEAAARALLETPGAVAAMQAHGVTLEEAVAISMYTSQAYVNINDQIRTGNETPEITQLREKFTSGLAKLPSFEGTVYRGSHLPKEVGLQHQEGSTITATGIYSTTFDEDQKFPNINYDIVIEVKQDSGGKDISMFSDKPHEMEVAFPPGTQFHVESRVMSGREEFSHMHPPDYGGIPAGVVNLTMREV